MHILLVGLTNMLSTILATTFERGTPGATVDRVDGDANLRARLRSSAADVVVMPDSDTADAHVRSLLTEFPRLRVLAINRGGVGGILYRLRLNRQPLRELSAQQLSAALCADGTEFVH